MPSDRVAARDSGLSELAKGVIRHWFARRHRGYWEHYFALHSIKDGQWWLRNIGRTK